MFVGFKVFNGECIENFKKLKYRDSCLYFIFYFLYEFLIIKSEVKVMKRKLYKFFFLNKFLVSKK